MSDSVKATEAVREIRQISDGWHLVKGILNQINMTIESKFDDSQLFRSLCSLTLRIGRFDLANGMIDFIPVVKRKRKEEGG